MKNLIPIISLSLWLGCNCFASTLHVDPLSPNPMPPYSSWSTAATNLQDTIEAALPGDLVLVANGVYATGGKVMAGDLTNRIAVTKPITVKSAAGPSATIIQGAWDFAATNGPGAVRCVWLTNGAVISGFTIRGGATRGVGDAVSLQTGGGIWCVSTNARIENCIIQGNAAGSGGGGGAFRGTLFNTLVRDNVAFGSGGGTAFSSLANCTVNDNLVINAFIGGVFGQPTNRVHNSIVWDNRRAGFGTSADYSGVVFTNSCTRPLPPGLANINSDPLFETDRIHLQAGSPCLNAGNSAFATGTDLDGQPWSNPPAMGCDQRLDQLAVGAPEVVPTGDGKVRLRISPIGAPAENYWWFKDGSLLVNDARISGAQSAELSIRSIEPADAGLYHAVVTNNLGSVTSAVARVRPLFADANSLAPAPPYTNWATAALTIQDVIDAANGGDLIVVADGIYATGGVVVSGDLTNRVALGKAVMVTSANGPADATIKGEKDLTGPNGNGNNAVRPVWMDNWTSLAGFTIQNGATRTNGDVTRLQSGGGIWGLNTSAVARGCVLTNNAAQRNGGGALHIQLENCVVTRNVATDGGGVYQGLLNRCHLIENQAFQLAAGGGGGAYSSVLRNSLVHKNTARNGGGTYRSVLYNCTVTENSGRGIGFGDFAYNSILWGNTPGDYGGSLNFHYSTAKYDPALFGVGGTNNLFVDPQLVDAFHLSENSPCRGAGGPLFVSGTDLDGDVWLSPVSMGADEFFTNDLNGPLSVAIEAATNHVLPNRALALIGRVSGRASRIEWFFGEGQAVTNVSYLTHYGWANPGDYTVTFTAHQPGSPIGVSASTVIHVLPFEAPALISIEKLTGFVFNTPYDYYQFSFQTQLGVSNVIEYATNLVPPVNWMPLKTSTATNLIMRETDVSPTNTARFYRLLAK